jgi:hypothetical protein
VLLRFEEIEEALPDLGCGHREMEWIGVGRRARAVGEGGRPSGGQIDAGWPLGGGGCRVGQGVTSNPGCGAGQVASAWDDER